jgi:hypothetical protein
VTQRLHLENLAATRSELQEALGWLRRSHDRCRPLGGKEDWSEEDFDAFEALTSRFARVSDMLLQKYFRALDLVELSEGGTLLDVLLRAEKRGIIRSADDFLLIRELRNEISHEYANEGLKALFESVLIRCPDLVQAVESSLAYATRYFVTETGIQNADER